MTAELSKEQIARYLAGKSIAAAAAFIDGRSGRAQLSRDADQLSCELPVVAGDPACNALADPARLLVVAMMHTAVADGPRLLRWRAIMAALLDLVQLELMSQRRGSASGRRDYAGNPEILRGARAE